MKNNKLKRYSLYWSGFLLRAFAPIGVTIWQFGLFKDNAGWFSRIQGNTIIGLVIALWISKDELVAYLESLENKAWFKSSRQAMIWILVCLTLLWARNFFNEMFTVVLAFTGGSIANVPLSVAHNNLKQQTLQSDKLNNDKDETPKEKSEV